MATPPVKQLTTTVQNAATEQPLHGVKMPEVDAIPSLLRVSPLTSGLVVQLTRTRANVVAGPVTVQRNRLLLEPAWGTTAASVLHVIPLSRLSSIRAVADVPRLCVHAIVCPEPTAHVTGAIGELMVMNGAATVKLTLLASRSAESRTDTTRMRAANVAAPSTVHQ